MTYMGKIEERLPLTVITDWWKLVVRDKLDDGSSAELYKALMRFLDEEKERVELQTSSLNRSSGSGGGKAVTNCVVGSIVNPNNDRNNRADSSPYNGRDSNRTRQ